MAIIEWDAVEDRLYSTGIDRVALYKKNASSTHATKFDLAAAWSGVTAVNESPSGAEVTKQYADNIDYLALTSKEEFALTLEAFFSPEEFDECDGMANLSGLKIHQVPRVPFCLAYRTLVGTYEEEAGTGLKYEYHLVYNCRAGVASRDHATVNDSPEAGTFSWEISTTSEKLSLTGATSGFKPSAHVIIRVHEDETAWANKIAALENVLFGATYDSETGEVTALTGYMPSLDELATALA